MRPRYANVVSTLALVVALGGTGAYAAGQITGKDIKNNSVAGKDVKDRSLTAKDVRPGSLGTQQLSSAVRAALASEHATEVKATVPDKGLEVSQSIGTVAGIPLEMTCGLPAQGVMNQAAVLYARLAGATAYIDYQKYREADELPDTKTSYRATTAAGRVGIGAASGGAGEDVTSTSFVDFALLAAGKTWSGNLVVRYDKPTRTCRASGWILHP
jgi:hypothetical protein